MDEIENMELARLRSYGEIMREAYASISKKPRGARSSQSVRYAVKKAK